MTGINLPPSLAARRAELVKSEQEFIVDALRCDEEAVRYDGEAAENRADAGRCRAEIAGIDAAAEAFADVLGQATGERIAREEQPAAAPSDPPKERRERRDIRGIVLDALRTPATAGGRTTDQLADLLPDVRRVQIESAIAYHEAGGRICYYLPGGYWQIAGEGPEPTRDPDVLADELALGAAG